MGFEQVIVLGNYNEWLDKSLTDLKNKKNCKLINTYLPCNNKILLRMASIHYSPRLNKRIKMPFKRIWYRYFCKCIFPKKEAKILVIIYDWNILGCNESFLKYLKKHFKNLSLVYVFTNIIQITNATKTNFVPRLKLYYDLVYSFEEKDAIENGFYHTQLVYSKNDTIAAPVRKEVFFAGKAKDRLQMLLGEYHRFKELGFSCNFHIIDVDDNEIVPLEGVEYNRRIGYKQVIQETSESMCVVEIPQKNSTEWTIKLCEAIYYNKIFITTNKRILDAPFYDKRYMFYVERPEDISAAFFQNCENVQYKPDARYYFSVERFLKMISDDLNRRFKNE